MSELFQKAEQFMIAALAKKDNKNDILHHQLTVKWIKELKPDADEALLIAGVMHDIERAVFGDWKKGSMNPDWLTKHQMQSADIAESFLSQEEADEELIERVKELIEHHEEGGDEDQNVLNDADCLAIFEDKAMRFVEKAKEEGNEKEMKKKIEFTFNRIKSEKARKMAEKWYNEAIKRLI